MQHRPLGIAAERGVGNAVHVPPPCRFDGAVLGGGTQCAIDKLSGLVQSTEVREDATLLLEGVRQGQATSASPIVGSPAAS